MAKLTSTGQVASSLAKHRRSARSSGQGAGFGRIRRWYARHDGVKYVVRPASNAAGQRSGVSRYAWREKTDDGVVTCYQELLTGAKTLLIVKQPNEEPKRLLFAAQWAAMAHAASLAGVKSLPWSPSQGRGRRGATRSKVRSRKES